MEHPANAARPPRAERPVALQVTVAYLLLTLPLVFRNGIAGVTPLVVALHLVALATTGLALARPLGGQAAIAAAWLPLALVPALYAELPHLMRADAAGVAFNDQAVIAWEHALFGMQPAQSLAGMLPGTALSEVLHLGYLSYYAIVFVPPLLLFASGERHGFELSAAVVVTTFALCFLAFALWPVEGPRYRWPAPAGIAEGPIRALVLLILEGGSSRGAAFPSSHAAVAVAQSLVLLRVRPRLGLVVAALTVLLLVGAVHGGFHYGIDMVAGTLLGAVAGGLGAAAYRRGPPAAATAPVTGGAARWLGPRREPWEGGSGAPSGALGNAAARDVPRHARQ